MAAVAISAPLTRATSHTSPGSVFQASSTALRKGDAEFAAWVDKQLVAYYQSGQTQKWYEQALSEFGLDPKLAPPIMKEMIK